MSNEQSSGRTQLSMLQAKETRHCRSKPAFPLTLTLSLREREYRAPSSEESRRFGLASSGKRFSLSPGGPG
jgi:hypothetical protein